ncbi:unnamed protein product [Caenorhabditis auriculariae]|uniref:Uncharacterized protein n=1 Tax=Caenorhabditis auriculariae TaxID=2777116 RepID=A0A8S1HJQ7_9PELO|nr:unnamed protein product [Caenorhabditis auriculariae]
MKSPRALTIGLLAVSQLVLAAEHKEVVEDFESEESTTTRKTPTTTETRTTEAPEEDLDEKLQRLEEQAQQLVIDYVRSGRQFNGDLRRRLVMYVVDFSPVQKAVERGTDQRHIQQIRRIQHRFRTGMRINYSSLKKKVDKLVAHLLAPIFAPFWLLQSDETPTSTSRPTTRFAAPVVEAPQSMSDPQSSFVAQEFFPSSMPSSPWMQPSWFQAPQAFSNPLQNSPYFLDQQQTPFFRPFRNPFEFTLVL